jgi:hypothetical protein
MGKKIKFIFLDAEEGLFSIRPARDAGLKLVINLPLRMTRKMKKNRKTPFFLRKNGASDRD